MPEKWYRIFKKKFQIHELPDDGTKRFQRNLIDRYLDRPDESFKNDMYRDISNICFSEFCLCFTQNQGKQKI